MNYVFVFLGEFGYELFNWQGTIRKLSKLKKSGDKIICCSRANLYPFYEYADLFVDISNVDKYQNSVACGYFARHPKDGDLKSSSNFLFDIELKTSIRDLVMSEIKQNNNFDDKSSFFVFSSDYNEVAGLKIGCRRDLFGIDEQHSSIYEDLNIDNNLYAKISIVNDSDIRKNIEKKLGWSLNEKYILFQNRERNIVVRSKEKIVYQKLLQDLSENFKIVLLSFNTGRKDDSFSKISELKNCYNISISNFPEQGILIQNAALNIFSTEGDFGSHIYIPPFMGKDVIAIAPKDIYEIGTTPISYWNDNVFKFGGKIYDYISEEVLNNESNYTCFLKYIFDKIEIENNLKNIEVKFNNSNFDDYYLWPRTPKTYDHQDKIRERVGVDDYADVPNSRSNMIINKLEELVGNGFVNQNFNLLDIASGDSIVLWRIKKVFKKADCYGLDCLKEHFGTHKQIQEDGVKIYAGFLQHLYYDFYGTKADVALMLNSYRGWESADLRENEKDIPELIDNWFKTNCKYAIVTATREQIEKLSLNGFDVELLGKGEDLSFMVCISAKK